MSTFPPKGKTKRDLFLGRFQPFHNGHSAIVKMMKNNPVIVLVKGGKSSADAGKNPFTEEYQLEMVKKVYPHLESSISPNGFLPGILGFFRKKGQEITRIFCGADRIDGYKKAIESANAKMDPEYHYEVEFVETPRVTSATKVREAIRSGNETEFRRLMPKELWGEWEKMKGILSESVEVDLVGFRLWLSENR